MAEVKLSFQWRKLRLSNKFILPKLIGHRGVKNLKPEYKKTNIVELVKRARLEEKNEKRNVYLYAAAAISALAVSGLVISL